MREGRHARRKCVEVVLKLRWDARGGKAQVASVISGLIPGVGAHDEGAA